MKALPSASLAALNLLLALNPPAALSQAPITRVSGAETKILTRTSTSTSDTITQSDCGKLISYSNAGAISVALPASSALLTGCWMDVQNTADGTVTLTPSGSTIDGASSVALTTNQGVRIVVAASGYLTQRGQGFGATQSSTAYSADGSTLSLTGTTFSANTAVMASRATAAQAIDTTCVILSGSSTAYVGATRGNILGVYADGMRVIAEIDTTTAGGAITLDCGAGPKHVYQNDGASNPTASQWVANQQVLVVYGGGLNAGAGGWRILSAAAQSSGGSGTTYSADGSTLTLTGTTFSANTTVMASRAIAAQAIDTTCVIQSGSSTAYVGATRGNTLGAYVDGMRVIAEIDTTTAGGAITLDCGAGPKPVYQNDGASNPTASQWVANQQILAVYGGALNAGAGGWRILSAAAQTSGGGTTYAADGTTLTLTGTTFSANTAVVASRVTAAQAIDTTCVILSGSSTAYVGATRGNVLGVYADGMRVIAEVDTTTAGGAITFDCGAGPKPVYQNDGASNPTSSQWAANQQVLVVYGGALNAGSGGWRILTAGAGGSSGTTAVTTTMDLPIAGYAGGSFFSWDVSHAATGCCSTTVQAISLANTGTPYATKLFTWPSNWDSTQPVNILITWTGSYDDTLNMRVDASFGCLTTTTSWIPAMTYGAATASSTLTNTFYYRYTTVLNVNPNGCTAGEMGVLKIARDNTVASNSADSFVIVGAAIQWTSH